MASQPDSSSSQPNADSLARILDHKDDNNDHAMDTAEEHPEEEEPEVETVAKEGYCIECEGARPSFIFLHVAMNS